MARNQQTRARYSGGAQERFSTVPGHRVPRSAFNNSYSHKTTFNSGDLIPIYHEECLPGDTLSVQPTFLCRMATPIKPYMDGIHFDVQWWCVPYRLLWDNFAKMMGEQENPGDHTDYTIPQMPAPASGHQAGSIADYLGIPTEVQGIEHSALYHRAYNLIYNEWYRDENLQDRADSHTIDGPDTSGSYPIRKRGKRKDYFSGALPFSQKGEPVRISMGDRADLFGQAAILPGGTQIPTFNSGAFSDGPLFGTGTASITDVDFDRGGAGGGAHGDLAWAETSLYGEMSAAAPGGSMPYADLSTAEGTTINALREAVALQHMLERDARGGTRMIEQNLAHFGVMSEDFRLQRPEILGTTSMQVIPYAVAQTSETDPAVTSQGNLAAYAVGTSSGRGFVKTCTEHMIILGIASVRAELSYQQGLSRAMTRKTRFEFYFPDLATLGEQAILSREIFADGTGAPASGGNPGTGDYSIWGYQPRYEEYRHRQSMITGEFRSVFAESLDLWHLSQDFLTRPVLNDAFIQENPPIARIIELTDEPEFLLDCFFKVRHVRPMPQFAVPGLTRF